jgi:hypothetical protein
MRDKMVAELTHESFEPHIGTAFALSAEGQDETLTLAEVSPGKEHPNGPRRAFVLVFDGSRTDGTFQGHLYTLTHPEMGELPIYIAPFERNADGTTRYQAVFN